MRVLVLNAGSSTLKASVLDGDGRDPLFTTTLEWGADASRAEGRAADFEALLERLVVEGIPVGSIEAIGHRVVHGGTRFTAPTLVDDEVLDELDGLADLAPLHNPVAVETIRAALVALPGVPEAAAFDTAFHATLPPPRSCIRCPPRGPSGTACAASASTGCRSNGRQRAPRSCSTPRPRTSRSSSRISAAAAR